MRKALELLAAASGRAAAKVVHPLVAGVGSVLRPARDPHTLEQLLHYRGWVYKACNVRANRVAAIDFQMVDVTLTRDGKEERTPVPVHPMYELLGRGGRRSPNPLTTSYNFWRQLEIDLGLTGNHYWIKLRDASKVTERGGIPRELWRVRPDRMLPVIDKSTGLIIGWGCVPAAGGRPITWPAEDVVHFKYPHPTDPYLGFSPIMSNVYALNIDQFNHIYQQRFFEQGALATIVITSPDEITETDAKEVLETFQQRKAGSDKAWLPIIVGGGTTVTPITLSNRDLEAIKLMEWSLEEVLSIYGVSKTQLGLAGDVNLSNALALDVAFNKNIIKPELDNVEHQIEKDLIPDYPVRGEDIWLEVDFENPVPGDREFELQEDTQLLDRGGRTLNEVRGKRGDPPYPGVIGDMIMVPFGTQFVDPEGDVVPGLDATATDPSAPEPPADDPNAPRGAAPWLTRADGAPTAEERTAFWRAWSQRATTWENRVTAFMRREFGRQLRAVLAQLKKEARGVRVALDIDTLVAKALGEGADQILRQTMGEVLARLIQREGAQAMALVSSEPFDWKGAVTRYLRTVENRIVGINRTTEQALREQLIEGVANEESIREIGKRIRAVFETASQFRAEVIARTEVLGASNYGALEGYRQGGSEKKGWLGTRDDRIRDAHREADGQVVPIGSPFSVGGEPLMYPGDPSGSPGNVIQCRCTIEPL